MSEITRDQALEVAQNGSDEQVNRVLRQLVDVDRRVISRKETIGYMIFDASNGFNINGHKDLFAEAILKISLDLQSYFNIVAGIWDIVDDIVIGGIIEKTRTRWGKFIPYMAMSGLPLAAIALIYWLLPSIFGQQNVDNLDYLPKFFAWAALELLFETFGNFQSVSVSGYMSTITPYPSDRRRIQAIAQYSSIIIGRIPGMVVEFILDFIKNGIVKTGTKTAEQAIKSTFTILGPATMIISGIIITWYCSIAKERVHQKVDTPKIKESVKMVFANRPLLAYMISAALGSFGTGITTNSYYRYVLDMTTFETIAGIPSVFFQPIGFSQYNKLAAKFSTKSLFMVSQVAAKSLYIPLYFYGICFKTKDGKKFYQKRIPMLPVTAVWEIIYACFWGVKSISANEIKNECNDYIEWKYGQRNEAMLSAASTVLCKIPNRANAVIQPKIKKWIGFDQTAYATLGAKQSERTQHWLFAMATIITAFVVLTSILPMFFYNINKEQRDKMYLELNERRVKIAESFNQLNEDEQEEA